MSSTLDGIEAEDGKLDGMVTLMKNDILTWMSASLLFLVPDKSNNKLLRDITNPSTGTNVDIVYNVCQIANSTVHVVSMQIQNGI